MTEFRLMGYNRMASRQVMFLRSFELWTRTVATLSCAIAACANGADGVAATSPPGAFAIEAPDGFKVEASTRERFGVHLVTGSRAFNQSAVKQSGEAAKLGPRRDVPHFAVRFALPLPPENDTNLTGRLVGIDAGVLAHNHSPGLTVLPNGDVLAIYFSAEGPRGHNERAPSARFIQARLRHGAQEWDLPELFFNCPDYNDQSALLWTDGGTVRFFGGGRENPVPFKMGVSEDSGTSWKLSLPVLDAEPRDFTAQPVFNAFRDLKGAMYFAMDAEEDASFLWRSVDGGATWRDMGGRTGGRHSTIVPIGDGNTLLSIGGKNTAVNGFTPQNISTNWGATWSESKATIFSPLGGNQRPALIRLANGHLCFVTDSYHRNKKQTPPGWTNGAGAVVAISKDDGATWRIKRLPVELPHEADRAHGTLGYASVAQAPNGVIHVLATMTHPCLHYEFNEAWVFSDEGEVKPEWRSARRERFTEHDADGKIRIRWSAKVFADGRYVLDGPQKSFYSNGRPEHEAEFDNGFKLGRETFWAEDGTKVWSWQRNLKRKTGTWTHYWPDGRKRLESEWNLNPRARDAARSFIGMEAHGTATHWDENGKVAARHQFRNGELISGTPAALVKQSPP